jgi:hypothetical protein
LAWLAATILAAAACGAHQPRVPPVAMHAEVTDPAGDARPVPDVASAPDLVGLTADVAGNTVTFRVRFAPATFDRDSTRVTIQLDTDSAPATGMPTPYGLGIDYIIDLWAPTRRAVIQRATPAPPPGNPQACNPCYVGTGTARVALLDDGMTVAVRLSRMANPHGPMTFRVLAYAMRPGARPTAPTVTADFMPDVTLPAGRIQ